MYDTKFKKIAPVGLKLQHFVKVLMWNNVQTCNKANLFDAYDAWPKLLFYKYMPTRNTNTVGHGLAIVWNTKSESIAPKSEPVSLWILSQILCFKIVSKHITMSPCQNSSYKVQNILKNISTRWKKLHSTEAARVTCSFCIFSWRKAAKSPASSFIDEWEGSDCTIMSFSFWGKQCFSQTTMYDQ